MDRRTFLAPLLGATAGFAGRQTQPAISYQRIRGANDRIRLGLIGLSTNSIGKSNLLNFSVVPGVEIAALCDIYAPHLADAASFAPHAALHWDFRRVIEDNSIDAVCISTPDWWHPLMTCLAFETGKHVYCEKPLGRYPYEVLVMMAARRTYREAGGGPIVFQNGQWQHSDAKFVAARDLLRAGAIGSSKLVRSWILQQRTGLGPPRTESPYPELGGTCEDAAHSPEDGWNMWLGPAPYRGFTRQICHYDWRNVFPYGSGIAGDWGPHLGPGVGLWALEDVPKAAFRITTYAAGMGAIPEGDIVNAPMNWRVGFDFGRFAITFDYDGCWNVAANRTEREQGVLFLGTDGQIFVNREPVEKGGAALQSPFGLSGDSRARPIAPARNATGHFQNFADAIRAGDPARCATRIESTGLQSFACLLAAAHVSMLRADPEVPPIDVDPVTLRVLTKEAVPYLMRPYRAPWDREWHRIVRTVKAAEPGNVALHQV
jgi:hypothetical protein